MFLENLVYAYGAPQYILTNNERQFVVMFFDSVCVLSGFKDQLSKVYH